MKLSKEFTTVTRFSKALALTLFITLPIFAFSFGMKYQKGIDEQKIFVRPTPEVAPVACTLDARICPDGTAVGRIPPNCEFEECPVMGKKVTCGGIEGKGCSEGYYCKYDGAFPDAAGTCEKDSTTNGYVCPQGGYVDCMPGPREEEAIQCTTSYLQWAKENCPDFQGAAY